jgi:hypothetical protein
MAAVANSRSRISLIVLWLFAERYLARASVAAKESLKLKPNSLH